MLELFDEIISSSPEPKKRLNDSIAYRKNKRKRRNNETEISDMNESNLTLNLETIHSPLKENFDLSAIYWEDDNDAELEFLPHDIYAEEKLLERANREKINYINNSEKFLTVGFETVTQFSQKLNLNSPKIDKKEIEILDAETQFNLPATLFENLCNGIERANKLTVQMDHETYNEYGAGCSKFLSPIKKSTSENEKTSFNEKIVPAPRPETEFGSGDGAGYSKFHTPIENSKKSSFNEIVAVPGTETQFGISESQFAIFCKEVEGKVDENSNKRLDSPKIQNSSSNWNTKSSLAQSILDDFSELEDPTVILSFIKSKPIIDLTPNFRFRNKTLRTYSSMNRVSKLNLPRRKITKINLETIYDSDSSQSSGLSVQKDEICLNVITKHEKLNLETSQQVCDNLLNLSTFFSETVVEDKQRSPKKCVFKDKKWMLEYIKSNRNYSFPRSVKNDEDFLGFSDSDDEQPIENELCKNLCKNKTENLDIFQEDIDIFNELEDNCKGFTQVILDKSFGNDILEDIVSKNDLKKPSIAVPSTVILNNCKLNSSSKTELPEDVDIFNAELWQDDDLLTEIKTQNCINNIKTNKSEDIKCQIPLNSKFNGLKLAIKNEILKENHPLAKSNENQIENQIFEGFKFASKKPVIISENAIKHAEKLIAEVLTEDNLEKEEENKENNSNSIPKEVKFKTASNKSIQTNDEAMAFAKEFLKGIDVESFTDDFDFDNEMTSKSTTKKQLSNDKFGYVSNLDRLNPPKNILLEANNFLNGITAEISNLQTPQFVSFKTSLGKPISISEKSLIKAEKFINETNNEISDALSKTDDNFKIPTFEGFQTGKGKPIKISERALQKAAKMMEELNNEIHENLDFNNCKENSFPTEHVDINLNSCIENEIKETNLEEADKSIIENNLVNSEKPKKNTRKSKNKTVLSEISFKRVTRSSSRINTSTNTSLESANLENPKYILNIDKEYSANVLPTNVENTITNKTETSTTSLNNMDTSISTPLSHKTTISRTQFSALTNKRNILSLTKRDFKPPVTSFDENVCTPIRNLENTTDKSFKNDFETPNLKEFFNSVNNIETSTPKNSILSQLTLTKEVTPSTVALMKNQMNNSSFNKQEMRMINWNEKSTDNLNDIELSANLSRSINSTNNKATNRIVPSPKIRVGRLKMWNKPPQLLPLAFIDSCKPSGLNRNSFMNKIHNQSIENVELINEMNNL